MTDNRVSPAHQSPRLKPTPAATSSPKDHVPASTKEILVDGWLKDIKNPQGEKYLSVYQRIDAWVNKDIKKRWDGARDFENQICDLVNDMNRTDPAALDRFQVWLENPANSQATPQQILSAATSAKQGKIPPNIRK